MSAPGTAPPGAAPPGALVIAGQAPTGPAPLLRGGPPRGSVIVVELEVYTGERPA